LANNQAMRVLSLVVCATLTGVAAAQQPPAPIETPHLIATVSVNRAAAAPGDRVSIYVDVAPKAKMHVYAPEQKDYIAVSLKIDPAATFKAHAPAFPKPEKYFFEPLRETQLVYTKPFRIRQDVTLAPAAALRAAGLGPGAKIRVAGTLRYQACDDAICYFPKDVPVSWTIELKDASVK
jgi:hypothetical protein